MSASTPPIIATIASDSSTNHVPKQSVPICARCGMNGRYYVPGGELAAADDTDERDEPVVYRVTPVENEGVRSLGETE